MMWLLYYASVALAAAGARIAAWWNPKVRSFINGRKNWEKKLHLLPSKSSRRIWFHVSSLGEFEQARPVIERLTSIGGYDIVLTFFSPSGYEIRKNYKHATVMYLPLDVAGNAKKWMAHVNPDLAVFVKYDFWPGYLQALAIRSIPYLVIAAHFQPGRRFSSWSFPLTAALLKKCNIIFLQNADYLDDLTARGYTQVQVAGDTRIDRVFALPEEARDRLPEALQTLDEFDLVAGSTWPEDENAIIPVIEKLKWRAIIAPHDVTPSNIERIGKILPADHMRFSQLQPGQRPRILLIDNIGLLAYVYALGKIAYVGGGFGKNIHNILEPMAHGKPVITGPAFHNFPEAVAMNKQGGSFTIRNQDDLTQVLQNLSGTAGREAGYLCAAYIAHHRGATEIIVRYIAESIPFASNS